MTIILNAARMGTKEEAHEYLKKAFGFPDYYGGNLDALADCLGELDNVKIRICNTEEAGEYLERLMPVFRDHAEVSTG